MKIVLVTYPFRFIHAKATNALHSLAWSGGSFRAKIKNGLVLGSAVIAAGCQTPKSSVSVDYYQIDGRSSAALDRDILRKGPRIDGGQHAVAVARIKMIPDVAFQPGQSLCHITRAKVSVDARVTLPQWRGRKDADAELGKAWDNMEKYTRMHEAVHVAMAFSYARRMEQELRALKPVKSCSIMRINARKLMERVLEEHDAAQRDFDAKEQKRLARPRPQSKST